MKTRLRNSRTHLINIQPLHAPHLLELEIAQVLRRYVRSASISAERAAEALADFLDLPLTRYPHFVLLPRVWQMRHNLTAYGAAYLALAEALNAPLLTRDRALATTHSRARVHLI